MDFIKSIAIAASACARRPAACASSPRTSPTPNSTAPAAGGDPYRRQIVTFVRTRPSSAHTWSTRPRQPDNSDFRIKHEPGNPAADANGDVKYPNVNSLVEMTDLRDAQRSYEAKLNVITATRRMLSARSISSRPRARAMRLTAAAHAAPRGANADRCIAASTLPRDCPTATVRNIHAVDDLSHARRRGEGLCHSGANERTVRRCRPGHHSPRPNFGDAQGRDASGRRSGHRSRRLRPRPWAWPI